MTDEQHEGTLTCDTHGLLAEGVMIPPGMDQAKVGLCAMTAGLHATRFPDCVLTFGPEPIGSAQARAEEARRIEEEQARAAHQAREEALRQKVRVEGDSLEAQVARFLG